MLGRVSIAAGTITTSCNDILMLFLFIFTIEAERVCSLDKEGKIFSGLWFRYWAEDVVNVLVHIEDLKQVCHLGEGQDITSLAS